MANNWAHMCLCQRAAWLIAVGLQSWSVGAFVAGAAPWGVPACAWAITTFVWAES